MGQNNSGLVRTCVNIRTVRAALNTAPPWWARYAFIIIIIIIIVIVVIVGG